MSLIQNFKYRPEIDGLRAIAVLSVVFFHAHLKFTGGFVGVDVFFVISGYLITSLILRDLDLGRFSMANFWERRARRILPASIVMVLVVLAVGWFFMLPVGYESLGRSALLQSLFSANFYFWQSINYFSGPAEEQPLLHMWSLAVEEQYYLLFPLLLVLCFRYPVLRSRAVLIWIFSVFFTVSLVASIYVLPRAPSAAFYLLPTRAWELLAGSIVAVLPISAVPVSRSLREAFTWGGILAIVIPVFIYTKSIPFPGLAALPPCLGTVLILWGGGTSGARENYVPSVCRLLSIRPIVFIGLISYSFYLWHWPIFAFVDYWGFQPNSFVRIGLVGLGFILAMISWWFVETPFRLKRLGGTRISMFKYSVVGLLSMIIFGWTLAMFSGFPSRFSEQINLIDACQKESEPSQHFVRQLSFEDAIAGDLPSFGYGASKFLVWGDSHAKCMLPGLSDQLNEDEVELFSAWYPSTPPVLGFVPTGSFSLGEKSVEFNQSIFDFIESNEVDAVLMVCRLGVYAQKESQLKEGAQFDAQMVGFIEGLRNTITQLSEIGCRVVVLLDVPEHKASVPKVLIREELFGANRESLMCDVATYNARAEYIEPLVDELAGPGVEFVDVGPLFFDSVMQRYKMRHGGESLYYDSHHLTRIGSVLVAEKLASALLETTNN